MNLPSLRSIIMNAAIVKSILLIPGILRVI
nr:unnamed protein product [Callosobruchus analis]